VFLFDHLSLANLHPQVALGPKQRHGNLGLGTLGIGIQVDLAMDQSLEIPFIGMNIHLPAILVFTMDIRF